MDRTTAIAIFDDRVQAQRAIAQLNRAGFTEREIRVTARDMRSASGRAQRGVAAASMTDEQVSISSSIRCP